jgi:hypothetical protein
MADQQTAGLECLRCALRLSASPLGGALQLRSRRRPTHPLIVRCVCCCCCCVCCCCRCQAPAQLQCPKCIALNLPKAPYCSQDCFKVGV